MLNWLRKLQHRMADKALATMGMKKYWQAMMFVVIVEAALIYTITFLTPLALIWDFSILAGAAILLVVSDWYFNRVDPQEVTDEPLSVITDALRKDTEDTRELDMVAEEGMNPPKPSTRKIEVVQERHIKVVKDRPQGARVPKRLRDIMLEDEEVEMMKRLHYFKLIPWGVMTAAALAAVFYLGAQPEAPLWSIVLMIAGFAAMVGFPIYRVIRRVIKAIRTKHIVYTIGAIVITVAILREKVLDFARWLFADVIWNFMQAIELDRVTFENVMIVIFWIALMQLIIRVIEWRVNPAVVTTQRLIVVRGLLFHAYPSMFLQKLTDQNFKRLDILPFGKLIVESAGQDQSLTMISYFPVALFKRIRTGHMQDED